MSFVILGLSGNFCLPDATIHYAAWDRSASANTLFRLLCNYRCLKGHKYSALCWVSPGHKVHNCHYVPCKDCILLPDLRLPPLVFMTRQQCLKEMNLGTYIRLGIRYIELNSFYFLLFKNSELSDSQLGLSSLERRPPKKTWVAAYIECSTLG